MLGMYYKYYDEPRFDLCSDDFSNSTQLTQCRSSSASCAKQEAKGGSWYGCVHEISSVAFKGELKIGGCFDTHQNFTGSNAGKWCFCDDSDGCNGSGFIQLSLTLISLVAMRFAF